MATVNPAMDPQHTAARAIDAWRAPLLLWAALVAALLIAFWPTAASLVDIWNNNVAFQHCLLIGPVIAWLVWERRKELAQLVPAPNLLGALPLAGAALLWLLGEAGHINIVRHAALVFMLQSTVLLAFGWQILRALLFPTFFALFMIPAGDQLVPRLQEVTAWFTERLLHLFSVPFTMDGMFFHITGGKSFEVAEACSGIRYLTTMLALGCVYANVAFKSPLRRLAVMALAIVVPIVANGIRAWGIIYLAYASNYKIAMGIDHILYGWVFFVFVMLLFMLICWRFADRPLTMPAIDLSLFKPVPAASTSSVAVASLAGVAIVAAVHGYAARMHAQPATLVNPVLSPFTVAGWSRSEIADRVDYMPIYPHASAERAEQLADAKGNRVQAYIAVYDRQREGKEMVAYATGAVVPATEDFVGWVWIGSLKSPELPGSPSPLAFSIYKDHDARDVLQWYYVNGKVLTSPTAAKLEAARARLLGGRTDAATLILSSERVAAGVSRLPVLEQFAKEMGPVSRLFESTVHPGFGQEKSG